MNYQIPSLQGMYLLSICAAMQTDNLESMLQDLDHGAGRLWCCPADSTVPEVIIEYKFDLDAVTIGVRTSSGQQRKFVVSYAGGLDSTLNEIVKMMRAGRLGYAPQTRNQDQTKTRGGTRKSDARVDLRAESQALAIEAGQR
jgi:hypothetical protein